MAGGGGGEGGGTNQACRAPLVRIRLSHSAFRKGKTPGILTKAFETFLNFHDK